MKKNTNSSLIFSALFAFILAASFISCKFNLSESKYLDRPDVQIIGNCYQIRGSYISNSTESITIFRQNAHDKNNAVERVAILFPKGDEDKNNQTFVYTDERVYIGGEYRYYVRFTDNKGVKNRTEWSDKKRINTGADAVSKLSYTITADYKYNPETMTLYLPAGADDFTKPDNSVITDIAAYKPALVFQIKDTDTIQTFEVPEGVTTSVSLKALLPQEFLYKDLILLGIVGQKSVYNSKNVLQSISWTNISSIRIVDVNDIKLSTIKLAPEYGSVGFDYSTTSDNES